MVHAATALLLEVEGTRVDEELVLCYSVVAVRALSRDITKKGKTRHCVSLLIKLIKV